MANKPLQPIASAAVFIATLYLAFTYHDWNWWIIAVLVLSFFGVSGSLVNLKVERTWGKFLIGDKDG